MLYSSILAVSQPAPDIMLVSLETAKDELNITASDTDTRLTRWIIASSAAIAGYINRVLRMETVVETLRASGFYPGPDWFHYRDGFHHHHSDGSVPGISLNRYPVVTMTSIVEDGITLDPAADYEVDGEAGIVYRLSDAERIGWSSRLVVLSYSGGYATTDDVPPDIQTACLLTLRHRWSAQGRDPMLQRISVPGVLDQQFWVGQTSKAGVSGLLPEVEALLTRFRDVHL